MANHRTVAEVVELYLEHSLHVAATRTHEERARVLWEFRQEFGRKLTDDCIPADLELWLDRHEQWRSPWTLRRVIATVERCFNWSARMRLIACNPFVGVTCRAGEPGRPMDPAEFALLLRHSSAVFRRVLIFLRFSGARPGELCCLRWDHIKLAIGAAVIPSREHKTGRTQRVPRPRVIVLHPVVARLLAWIGRRQSTVGAVFLNSRGKPWCRYSLSRRMKRLRKKLGLPLSCRLYGTRHAFGTDAILRGVELKTLSVLMGHTTTRTTEGYTHIAGKLEFLSGAVKQIFRTQAPPPLAR